MTPPPPADAPVTAGQVECLLRLVEPHIEYDEDEPITAVTWETSSDGWRLHVHGYLESTAGRWNWLTELSRPGLQVGGLLGSRSAHTIEDVAVFAADFINNADRLAATRQVS